mgnify:CR=1 FL=1
MTRRNTNTDHTLEISSNTELLDEARTFVTDAARNFGFREEDVAKIELAVDEACTNIIKHAYRDDPSGRIRLTVSTADRTRFTVTIYDNGIGFDASHYTMPDMREYFLKPRKGGLGIVLMKRLMDEVEYDVRRGTSNAIRLIKYLHP